MIDGIGGGGDAFLAACAIFNAGIAKWAESDPGHSVNCLRGADGVAKGRTLRKFGDDSYSCFVKLQAGAILMSGWTILSHQ